MPPKGDEGGYPLPVQLQHLQPVAPDQRAAELIEEKLVQSWFKIAMAKRLVLPPRELLHAAESLDVQNYCISPLSATGLRLPPAFVQHAGLLDGEVRACLAISMYCSKSQTFFGNTWTSPSVPLRKGGTLENVVLKTASPAVAGPASLAPAPTAATNPSTPLPYTAAATFGCDAHFDEGRIRAYVQSSMLSQATTNCALVFEIVGMVVSPTGVRLLEMGIGWSVANLYDRLPAGAAAAQPAARAAISMTCDM